MPRSNCIEFCTHSTYPLPKRMKDSMWDIGCSSGYPYNLDNSVSYTYSNVQRMGSWISLSNIRVNNETAFEVVSSLRSPISYPQNSPVTISLSVHGFQWIKLIKRQGVLYNRILLCFEKYPVYYWPNHIKFLLLF